MINSSTQIGLATVTSENFLPGTVVMLHSFLRHNPWFRGDIVVIYEELNSESIKALHSNFPNLRLHRMSVELSDLLDSVCREVPWLGNKRLQFGSLEILSLSDFDRLIFCDSDLFFLDSIESLFQTNDDLICCADGPTLRGNVRSSINFSEQEKTPEQTNQIVGTFNSGFMIIDSKLMTTNNYQSIFSLIHKERWESDTSGHTDQLIFNMMFKGKQSLVSPIFNFSLNHINDIKSGFDIKLHDIIVFHFTGSLKPWLPEKILHNRQNDPQFVYAFQKWNEEFISFLVAQNVRTAKENS